MINGEKFALPYSWVALPLVTIKTVWISYTAKINNNFFFPHIHTILVPTALAVWQLSPANTDGNFQYIIALEIIIVCRADSKAPPGTLGCQLQHGTAAKVTGLLPYGQPGNAEQSCSVDTYATPLAQTSQNTGLFDGAQKEPDEKHRGLSAVTNLSCFRKDKSKPLILLLLLLLL